MFVIHYSVVFGIAGGMLVLLAFFATVKQSVGLAVLLALLCAIGTALIVVANLGWCQNLYRRRVAEKKAQRERLENELDRLLTHECCAQGELAATYDGWHGTVHSFFFDSKRFAHAFERANPGKCLRDGQIHH
jgi:hypothetical protein